MRTVFLDIDTQIDFMFPAGALYVPGAELLLPAIRKLNAHAIANHIPLISTMDAHPENDAEFRQWPAHCVVGTAGQKKPEGTVFGTPAVVLANTGRLPSLNTPQIILEKLTTNCFENPHLEKVLETVEAERFVVYGVVTEICVKFAALGLLRTGKRVELVTDAMKHLSEPARDEMFAEFTAGGGVLTTVSEALRR